MLLLMISLVFFKMILIEYIFSYINYTYMYMNIHTHISILEH